MGTIFNCVAFSFMWIVIGFALEKIGQVFNHTITVLPTMQDAVNGFQITQVIFTVIPVLVWIILWFNYATNEASEAGGYV